MTTQRKPRRWVKMFKPRFAPLVRDNLKLQTMRAWPKRGLVDVPRPGDTLDARQWEGRAYSSPQVKLGERKIVDVDQVKLAMWRGEIGMIHSPLDADAWVSITDLDALARTDGFTDWADMKAWFLAEYKTLPPGGLHLYRVRWEPVSLP